MKKFIINLKIRFKRTLFAFFKEEILSVLNYDTKQTQKKIEYRSELLSFTRIDEYIILDENRMSIDSIRYGVPQSVLYKDALENCKKRLFDSSMEFIKVDESSVMDSSIYEGRKIRVSLFLGKVND